MKLCTFAASICRIFNHPGDLNLLNISFAQGMYCFCFRNQTGYMQVYQELVLFMHLFSLCWH